VDEMVSSIQEACEELELDKVQCRSLKSLLEDLCSGKKPKKKRKVSRWQQCITERRKDKPFDPQAIKKLAVEYRAGKCP
jgi:ATP-dependent protease HslVU (ClpYQ) ATPase subunit